jgi:hypothetical protein
VNVVEMVNIQAESTGSAERTQTLGVVPNAEIRALRSRASFRLTSGNLATTCGCLNVVRQRFADAGATRGPSRCRMKRSQGIPAWVDFATETLHVEMKDRFRAARALLCQPPPAGISQRAAPLSTVPSRTKST